MLQHMLIGSYRIFSLVRRNPSALVGLSFVVILILVAIFAPWIAMYDPQARDWNNQLAPPTRIHLFGTDDTGADIFSKVIYGSRTSIELAAAIVLLAGSLGGGLGVVGAYYGGVIDMVVMRLADLFLSLPGFILAMAVIVLIGSGIQNVMLALVIVRWPGYARLIRSRTLSVKAQQFVEAAKALGVPTYRIISLHIVPNVIAPVLVYATMDLGAVILAAAGLSFLGLGAGPGAAEWGRMVAEGRSYFFQKPWLVAFPGGAIFLSVMGFNLLGDGIRDILDPRLRKPR